MSSTSRPMFYIIDGHAVAYRQFFGLPVESFSLQDGQPTNAVFGFTRILLDLIKDTKPDYLAVSFDQGLSGRETVYPDYKGTRDKMPDELASQLDYIRRVVTAFNIPILELAGYEADDVIGTVAKQAEAQGVHCRIITGDRDLLQLLTEHITVQLPQYKSAQDKVFDIPAFLEKYTIRPDQLVDQKALMGDSSDNIPGVAGIGEKTSMRLLTQYETLDGIYAHIDELKGAQKKKLVEGKELAYISRDLAQIRCDLPVELVLESCISHDYDLDTVLELFNELEFRTLTNRLLKSDDDDGEGEDTADDDDSVLSEYDRNEFRAPDLPEAKTVIVQDEATLAALVKTLNNAKAITFDVESTSTDQMAADLVGIALATDDKVGYYIPVAHQRGQQLPMQQVLDALREPLTNPNIPKYAHNATYDLVVMQRNGIEVTPITFDTMIAEWLREPTSKFLGLKNLAMHELFVQMQQISDLIGTGKKQKTMDTVDIEAAAPYAADDAVITHRLADRLRPDLEKRELLDLMHTLEMPLVPVIAAMESTGVVLDTDYLAEMSQRLDERLVALEAQAQAQSNGYGEFNLNSPKQLNDVLFEHLNLPRTGIRKTAHGHSTDAATLQKLAEDTKSPIVKTILEYRELAKLKGTYVDALPELINPHTGRVHTSYNQTGTSTGRLSSSNPNLQNIPIRTEIGREVRRAFIAPEGNLLLAVDYSQIELRVLAHISKEPTLLEAFAEGQDIHRTTAAIVYGIDLDDVTYEQRSFAKRVNFGIIYGMSGYRLARDSDLTLPEANAFIDTYFERLPKVQEYIEQTQRDARTSKGLQTLFGRKRNFPALRNPNTSKTALQAELRAAVNMPIQGTAADIMKRAMIDVFHALRNSRLRAKMTLQVHDELVLEVPEDEIQQTRDLVVEVMETAYTMDAPLKANAEVGHNWRDMAPLQQTPTI